MLPFHFSLSLSTIAYLIFELNQTGFILFLIRFCFLTAWSSRTETNVSDKEFTASLTVILSFNKGIINIVSNTWTMIGHIGYLLVAIFLLQSVTVLFLVAKFSAGMALEGSVILTHVFGVALDPTMPAYNLSCTWFVLGLR